MAGSPAGSGAFPPPLTARIPPWTSRLRISSDRPSLEAKAAGRGSGGARSPTHLGLEARAGVAVWRRVIRAIEELKRKEAAGGEAVHQAPGVE